jgi:hypothetical protein
MDPEQLNFNFEARAAMMQENMRTVVTFMQGLVAEMPALQAQFERMQQGDLTAMADWLKSFEKNERLFAGLAEVIRKHEHA